MKQNALKAQLLNDWEELSPDQQVHAASMIRGLVSPRRFGATLDELSKIAGTLDDTSAREMLDAIEQGCERVDLDEW